MSTTQQQPFIALCLGLPGWASTRRNADSGMWGHPRVICHLLNFMVQEKITEADIPTIRMKATQSRLSVPPPPSYPTFLCWMSFLSQPIQFILAWNRNNVCRVAYPVACHSHKHACLKQEICTKTTTFENIVRRTFTGQMPFLLPNQQCQIIDWNKVLW